MTVAGLRASDATVPSAHAASSQGGSKWLLCLFLALPGDALGNSRQVLWSPSRFHFKLVSLRSPGIYLHTEPSDKVADDKNWTNVCTPASVFVRNRQTEKGKELETEKQKKERSEDS